MSVIFSGQVPVLEIGKGSSDRQGPKLVMTVGGKARSGGTSIELHGVLAVTGKLITGESGSSLMTCSVQVLRPQELGVKRITTSTHESWLTTAGKGLLTRMKSGQGRTKETLL